ncbi:phosphatase 2C [Coemansia sp. RSA 1286]|nr:phosphatase 2C [Coemansia sp. RSA 1286]
MTSIEQEAQKDSPSASTTKGTEPAFDSTKSSQSLTADANASMGSQKNDDNVFESPPALTFDADAAADVTLSTATFPTAATSSNSTIQPRPRLQRSSVPPPLDTENATKDADSTLRTRLLSTLSPTSSTAAEPAEPEAVEPLRIQTNDDNASGDLMSNAVAQEHPGGGTGTGVVVGAGAGAGVGDAQADDAHIGVSFSKNRRYRRTMEDAHYHKYDFNGVKGQSFMAVFDGHAGRQAAQWCGDNFADVFLQLKNENPELAVPELFNQAFIEADRRLASDVKTHSGCTAVVAYLEIRDVPDEEGDANSDAGATHRRQRRTLYCANAGDARAVLSRGGAAVRLTYDHKGDDVHEIERISESGGYVFNGRVNATQSALSNDIGILAVTRALGDSSLKQFVIGNPFTTETELDDDDDLLILACDGLWDVCSDQEAVDLIRAETDPAHASQALLDYALSNDSMDNITTMVFRLPPLPSPTLEPSTSPSAP